MRQSRGAEPGGARMWFRLFLVGVIASALLTMVLAATGPTAPVLAHEGQSQSYHDGSCYWWGQESWIGNYGQQGTAKGVNSLWDGNCTSLRIKLKYRNTSNNCVLTTATHIPPAFNVLRDGYHTDYVDADVLLYGTWYGFRVNHADGDC